MSRQLTTVKITVSERNDCKLKGIAQVVTWLQRKRVRLEYEIRHVGFTLADKTRFTFTPVEGAASIRRRVSFWWAKDTERATHWM